MRAAAILSGPIRQHAQQPFSRELGESAFANLDTNDLDVTNQRPLTHGAATVASARRLFRLPTAAIGVRHHLVDVCTPLQP